MKKFMLLLVVVVAISLLMAVVVSADNGALVQVGDRWTLNLPPYGTIATYDTKVVYTPSGNVMMTGHWIFPEPYPYGAVRIEASAYCAIFSEYYQVPPTYGFIQVSEYGATLKCFN